MAQLTLSSPLLAVLLLVAFVFAGRTLRKNWKEKGEGWQLKVWISGAIVVICFCILAFIPVAPA